VMAKMRELPITDFCPTTLSFAPRSGPSGISTVFEYQVAAESPRDAGTITQQYRRQIPGRKGNPSAG